MKNNLKNKKVIYSVIGVVMVVFIVVNILYSKINTAENDYVSINSTIINIKDNTLGVKSELLLLQDSIMKLNKDNSTSPKIDNIILDMQKKEYCDESKINKNIKQLDILNEEIEKMLDIYNSSEEMKKDMVITNAMIEVEGLDNLIDGIMEEHNKEYVVDFNEAIKKFPVNLVVKSKGWFEIDKFSSID